MFRLTFQILLAILLSTLPSLVVADPASDEDSESRKELRDEMRKELHVRVEHLATMLASTNTNKPDHGGKWPPGYKEEPQVIVYLAINELLRSGDAGLDEVLKHVDDKRYCYTYKAPSGCYHVTVGGACQRMAHRMICCYSDYGKLHFISGSLQAGLPAGIELTPVWRSKNKDTPLWKLQIQAIDAHIERTAKVDYEKSLPPHPHADKLNKDVFERLRAENIATLKAMKASIEASQEPYSPKSIDTEYGAMMALPWPTRNWGLEGR